MSEATTACPKCGAAIPPEAPQGLCPKCLLKQASFPTETGPTTRHARPSPPDRDELAAAFPHLQILELIGQGGMGFVYKARQPKLDRLVALKILAQPLAEQTHFAERFTREGRTLAKLNHPNIVTIHDFGQAGPFFYLLMEYVDGVNLRQAMKAGAINSTQALAIVPRICEALQYAHNEGVLHRDIKPDNILLDARGRVKIADFGIAKLIAEAVAENPLTGSGASLGTPHYMAPEQIEKPNAVDHRADIYSLGVVFYEMLTGELPLGRFSAPSEKSAIDPRLDEVVFQTLEKQPERRPQSADEVRTKVETISSGGTSQPASPSEGTVAFKMSRCFLTTPQFLRTRLGRFLRYTNKGELRLDENTLTFAPRHQNWIVIPLRAITSLTMGEFPAGIGKLKFISVTFTEKGNAHRFFFIPTRGAVRSIWNTNQLVEEWFNAIQNAAKTPTGRVPPSFKDDLDPLPTARKPELFPVFAKLALIFIAVPLFILGGLLVLYGLLRKPVPYKPNVYLTSLSNSFPDITVNNTNSSRILAVASLYSANNNGLGFRTTTEPAAGERFVPVIRFGDGPWGEPDNATTRLEYLRTPRGPVHNGIYTWSLPNSFNSGYETAAAIIRARAASEREPIIIYTNFVRPIFELNNPSGQSVAVGLRLQKSTVVPSEPPIVAKLTQVGGRSASGDGDLPRLNGWATPEIPIGYRVQAVGKIDDKQITTKTYESGNTLFFFWYFPEDLDSSAPFGGNFTLPSTKIDLEYGVPATIYSIKTRSGGTFTASLELVPLPGITPPPVTSTKVTPKLEPPAPAETLEITLRRRSVDPRRIFMQGFAPLTLDQNVISFVSYPPAPVASPNSNRRIPRTGQASSIPLPIDNTPGTPYYSSDNNLSVWRNVRGATNSESADFFWYFDEKFSLERDLSPAVDRFFENQNEKKIRLTADEATPLLRMTNAFGQIAECALEFKKGIATVKDRSAGVILSSFTGRTNNQSVDLSCGVAFPENVDIQVTGTFDNKPIASYLTRSLDGNGGLQCYWLYPEGFVPPQLQTAQTNQPARAPTVAMPAPGIPSSPNFINPIFEHLSQRVRSGDARITASEPLEVFAITNADGKILRGLLEINPKQISAIQSSPAPSQGPTKQFSLGFKGFISPNLLEFTTPIDLAFDESIRTMVRYNDGKWDDNRYASTFRYNGSDSRTLSLCWILPENFSFPFDVKPVLDDVFEEGKKKIVRLSTNQVVELFSLTNALKQRISCGLRYNRLPSSSSDMATITNAIFQGDPSRVTVQASGLVPPGTRLEPVATYGTNKYFGASLERRDFRDAEVKFNIPSELYGPGPIPRANNLQISRVLQIKRGDRAELFSLTNSENKVFRAFFEVKDVEK